MHCSGISSIVRITLEAVEIAHLVEHDKLQQERRHPSPQDHDTAIFLSSSQSALHHLFDQPVHGKKKDWVYPLLLCNHRDIKNT